MECKKCKGVGLVNELVDIVPTPDGPFEIFDDVECDVCKGTEEVKKEEKINE